MKVVLSKIIQVYNTATTTKYKSYFLMIRGEFRYRQSYLYKHFYRYRDQLPGRWGSKFGKDDVDIETATTSVWKS